MESKSKLDWRKSTFSNGGGGDCVEIARIHGGVLVRNSKRPDGGMVEFTTAEIRAFLAGCKAGEFDDLSS